MSPSSPAGGSDARRVRLSWPAGARQEAERPELTEPPLHPPSIEGDLRADEPASRPANLDVELAGASAVRRALIDAYDRLADRLLQRMRSMGEDMDADLAELRSEMAALRRSVDELDHRAQLKAIRASVDELRHDVAALRRVVLDQLDTTTVGPVLPTDPETGEVLDITGPVLAQLTAVRDELAAELVSLRRRIALRAETDTRDDLDDDQVVRIAEAVAARLADERRRRR